MTVNDDESLLEAVESACDPRAGFVENVESALHAGLAFLAANPDLAHRLTVAPFAAGESAARRHRRWLERCGDLLRAAAESGSDAPTHPDFVEPTIIAGVTWQISRYVLADRAERLEQLLPDLLEFTLVFYLDPAEVHRIARAARASLG